MAWMAVLLTPYRWQVQTQPPGKTHQPCAAAVGDDGRYPKVDMRRNRGLGIREDIFKFKGSIRPGSNAMKCHNMS